MSAIGKNPTEGRILDWVDVAKGIGICFVVYSHVVKGMMPTGLAPSHGPLADLLAIAYSFQMPLFFFLSGLFLPSSLRRRGPGGLVASKVDTLAYPFLLWSLVQGSIEVFASNYTNGRKTWSYLPYSLVHPGSQLWFLYALFVCFLVVAILSAARLPRAPLWAFLASTTAYILVPEPFSAPAAVKYLVEHLPFFAAGAMWGTDFPATRLARLPWLAASTTAVLVGQSLLLAKSSWVGVRGAGSMLLAGVSIALVAAVSARLFGPLAVLLKRLGRASMSIYLLHLLVTGGTRIVLVRLAGVRDPWIHVVAGCLMGLTMPLLFIRICGPRSRFLFSAPICGFLVRLQKPFRKAPKR